MKKIINYITITILLFLTVAASWNWLADKYNYLSPFSLKSCKVEKIVIPVDKDKDGIYDLEDIVIGARQETANKTRYRSAYYSGGYPPEDEGVCTDVVWRALLNAGYNLKEMMDKDIAENPGDYPRVHGRPDPNIDFRRVQNQIAFFKKYAQSLTTEVKPWDADNLKQWQGGDIVMFSAPYEHVAVISDKRRRDGVPLIIHNAGPYAKEEDCLLYWPTPITHHFRFPKADQGQ